MNSVHPDYNNAIASWKKAFALDPQNARALLGRGDAYYGGHSLNEG
jgi:hypothetical protein